MSSHQLQCGTNELRVVPHLWNRLSSASHRGYLFQISIVFVAYVIAGKLGQATANIRSSNLGPVWPAFGVAFAAVLICGYRVWPGVAAGAFLVAFFSPVPHLVALGQAAGATVAAISGAFLLYRFANFHPSLSRLSDALSLIVIGGFGSAIVSASIGVLVLYASNVHAYSGLGAGWLIYWLGDATGVLLVTPLLLTIPSLLQIRDRGRITEFAVLLLLLSVVCFIVFGDVAVLPARILSFVVLPFVIWAAIRFGVSACALSMLIVASIATIETALGSGPFVSSNRSLSAVTLDAFFGVLSVTGLMLASLVTEREHAEREREQILTKQAALEARLETANALRLSEERWRLAAYAGKMYAYEWDATTDAVVRSGEVASVLGREASSLTRQQLLARIHPDDRALFAASVTERTSDNPDTQISYRVLGRDGSVKWLEKTAHAYFDRNGRIVRMVGMVMDITERKRAEEAVFASEQRLRLAQEAAHIGTFERDVRTGRVGWAAGLDSLYGLPPGSVVGTTTAFFNDLIHPDDRERVAHLIQEALKTAQRPQGEWRVVWPDGSVHWIAGRWQILRNGSGEPSRVVGVNMDITERKQAEEALAGMSRKLIEAQEQERTRIARELHDDINQRLALLSVELEASRQNPPETATNMSILLTELRERISEISSDVQSLSHQLHSSQLEYLGIVSAARSFCREFSTSQNVEIDFDHDDIPQSVSPDISLCLFRVLQEALHNAVKYSQVRHFEVRLSYSEHQLHLTVSDRGVGFDTDAARSKGGLGLISMSERVRLVNGTISIESKSMGGTTVHVRVPLIPEDDSKELAG